MSGDDGAMQLNTVPETVLKKRKRDEQWAIARRDLLQRINKKSNRKGQEVFVRAEKLIKEFRKRESDRKRLVRETALYQSTRAARQEAAASSQKAVIARSAGERLPKEADGKGAICKGSSGKPQKVTERSSKSQKRKAQLTADGRLLLVIQIRSARESHRASKKILKELGLTKALTAVFTTATPQVVRMLHQIRPFVTYGTPDLRTVRHLILKRGRARIHASKLTPEVSQAMQALPEAKQGEGEGEEGKDEEGGKEEADGRPIVGAEWLRVPLTDNMVVEQALGDHGLICVEDLVQEVHAVGESFSHVVGFLWPFELTAPPEGFKKWGYVGGGGDGGFRDDEINKLTMALV